MMGHMGGEGFYEDDEPIEDVVAAFNSGPHGVTGPPRGQTRTLEFAGSMAGSLVTTPEENRPAGEPIQH